MGIGSSTWVDSTLHWIATALAFFADFNHPRNWTIRFDVFGVATMSESICTCTGGTKLKHPSASTQKWTDHPLHNQFNFANAHGQKTTLGVSYGMVIPTFDMLRPSHIWSSISMLRPRCKSAASAVGLASPASVALASCCASLETCKDV